MKECCQRLRDTIFKSIEESDLVYTKTESGYNVDDIEEIKKRFGAKQNAINGKAK